MGSQLSEQWRTLQHQESRLKRWSLPLTCHTSGPVLAACTPICLPTAQQLAAQWQSKRISHTQIPTCAASTSTDLSLLVSFLLAVMPSTLPPEQSTTDAMHMTASLIPSTGPSCCRAA